MSILLAIDLVFLVGGGHVRRVVARRAAKIRGNGAALRSMRRLIGTGATPPAILATIERISSRPSRMRTRHLAEARRATKRSLGRQFLLLRQLLLLRQRATA